MRRLILTILAVSLLFLGNNSFATEDWEKKLLSDGWNKVENKLLDRADTTWYGNGWVTKNGRKIEVVLYISPDGKEATFFIEKVGYFDTGKRWAKEDGTICSKWLLGTSNDGRCKTLWKKGDHYKSYEGDGKTSGAVWTIKKGNLEKL